jgi:hypothetical protein
LRNKIINEFNNVDRKTLHDIQDQFTIAYEIELESQDNIGEPGEESGNYYMNSDQIYERLAETYHMDNYIDDIYEYIRDNVYNHSGDIETYTEKLEVIAAFEATDRKSNLNKKIFEAYKQYMDWKNNSIAVNFLRDLVETYDADELAGRLTPGYELYDNDGVGFVPKGNLSFDFEKGLKKAEDYGPEDVAKGIKPLEENYSDFLHRLWCCFVVDLEFTEFANREDELDEVYEYEEFSVYTTLSVMGFKELALEIKKEGSSLYTDLQGSSDTINEFEPSWYADGSDFLLEIAQGILSGFKDLVEDLAETEEIDNPDAWVIEDSQRGGGEPKEVLSQYLPKFMRRWEDELKFEEDGSLQNGIEFSPETYLEGLKEAQDFLNDFFDDFNYQSNFRFSSRTGLHINIGLEAYDGSFNLMKGLLFLSEPRTKSIDSNKKYYAYQGAKSRLYSQWARALSPKVRELIIKELAIGTQDLGQRFRELTFENDTMQHALSNLVLRANRENGVKSTGFNVTHTEHFHYVEFRYPGHGMDKDAIYNLTEYYCYIIKLMTDPEYKKKEYMKKLIGYMSLAESEASSIEKERIDVIKTIPKGTILKTNVVLTNSDNIFESLDSFINIYDEYNVWLNRGGNTHDEEEDARNLVNSNIIGLRGSATKYIRFEKLVKSKDKTVVKFDSFTLKDGFQKEETSVALFLAMFSDQRTLEDAKLTKPTTNEFFPDKIRSNKEMGGFLSKFTVAYNNLFTTEEGRSLLYLPRDNQPKLLKLLKTLKEFIIKKLPYSKVYEDNHMSMMKKIESNNSSYYERITLQNRHVVFRKKGIDNLLIRVFRLSLHVLNEFTTPAFLGENKNTAFPKRKYAKLRKGTTSKDPVIRTLNFNEELQILKTGKYFAKVKTSKNEIGYVALQNLSKKPLKRISKKALNKAARDNSISSINPTAGARG